MSMESVACNSCYLFSKKLLQQCGEDVRSAESIIGSLDLKEKMQTCMTRGDKTSGCGKCLRGTFLSLPALCLLLPHTAHSLTHRQYK